MTPARTALPTRRSLPVRRTLPARRAVVAALLALLGACALVPPPNLRPPDIAIADLALTDIALDRLVFRVTVDTANPNDLPVPLTDIRMDLTVFGVELARGHVPQRRIELPALGRAAIPVEFTVPTGRLLDLLERIRNRGMDDLDYRLAGSARWGDSPFDIPFERSGNLDILRRLSGLLGTR